MIRIVWPRKEGPKRAEVRWDNGVVTVVASGRVLEDDMSLKDAMMVFGTVRVVCRPN